MPGYGPRASPAFGAIATPARCGEYAAFQALWKRTEPLTTFGTCRNRNLFRRFSRQAAPTTAANHAMEGNAHD